LKAELAILVPVLKRPHRVKPLMASIRSSLGSTPHNIYFIPNPDDLEEIREIKRNQGRIIAAVDGNYAKKINIAVELTSEPLIFTGADDLKFKRGWYQIAKKRLINDLGVAGVVGTNDLCNKRTMEGDHSTHSLVTRLYCQFGTIDEAHKLLHEGYPHEYVDDEFVETAKHRGAYVHAKDSIVEHMHPMARKAPMDALYAKQPQRMRHGRRIYKKRQRLWKNV